MTPTELKKMNEGHVLFAKPRKAKKVHAFHRSLFGSLCTKQSGLWVSEYLDHVAPDETLCSGCSKELVAMKPTVRLRTVVIAEFKITVDQLKGYGDSKTFEEAATYQQELSNSYDDQLLASLELDGNPSVTVVATYHSDSKYSEEQSQW
jgi:hypothetical protein